MCYSAQTKYDTAPLRIWHSSFTSSGSSCASLHQYISEELGTTGFSTNGAHLLSSSVGAGLTGVGDSQAKAMMSSTSPFCLLSHQGTVQKRQLVQRSAGLSAERDMSVTDNNWQRKYSLWQRGTDIINRGRTAGLIRRDRLWDQCQTSKTFGIVFLSLSVGSHLAQKTVLCLSSSREDTELSVTLTTALIMHR